MAKVQVTVCDECQALDRPTRHYRINSEGRVANADLCEPHGKVLESFLSRLGTTSAPRGSFEDKVKTVEEIEETKKARAARKAAASSE